MNQNELIAAFTELSHKAIEVAALARDYADKLVKVSACVHVSLDYSGKCFYCGKQIFVREPEERQ